MIVIIPTDAIFELEDMMNSPTSSHFELAEYMDCFYVDQQGSPQWFIDETDGTVFTCDDTYVAISVQDFAARWLLECNIYHKRKRHKPLNEIEQQYETAAL